MNLKNDDKYTDVLFVITITVGIAVLSFFLYSIGFDDGRKERAQSEYSSAYDGLGLRVFNPSLRVPLTENPSPKLAVPPSSNSTGVSIVLTDGRSVYDALYDAAFREGYPSQIYQDATEQRTVALAKVDVWLAQIKLQVARGPVCFTGLRCITDVNIVPEGTVVDVDYTREFARLASPFSVPPFK